jgi:hypothetical protein
VLIEGKHIRRRAHVEWHIGIQEALQIGLPDVNGGEIVVPSCGEQKNETDRRRLDHGCEHSVEVDAVLLGVAVGGAASAASGTLAVGP